MSNIGKLNPVLISNTEIFCFKYLKYQKGNVLPILMVLITTLYFLEIEIGCKIGRLQEGIAHLHRL